MKIFYKDLTCLNEKPYDNYWGDATIANKHTYSIVLTLDTKDKKILKGYIEISDNNYAEMAL